MDGMNRALIGRSILASKALLPLWRRPPSDRDGLKRYCQLQAPHRFRRATAPRVAARAAQLIRAQQPDCPDCLADAARRPTPRSTPPRGRFARAAIPGRHQPRCDHSACAKRTTTCDALNAGPGCRLDAITPPEAGHDGGGDGTFGIMVSICRASWWHVIMTRKDLAGCQHPGADLVVEVGIIALAVSSPASAIILGSVCSCSDSCSASSCHRIRRRFSRQRSRCDFSHSRWTADRQCRTHCRWPTCPG